MSRRLLGLAGFLLTAGILIAAIVGVGLVFGEPAGLTGQITKRVDGSPVVGAMIQVDGVTVQSQQDGSYRLALPPGQCDVRVTAPGFIGMTITRQDVNGMMTLDVAMVPQKPSAKEREILDASMRQISQSLSDEERALAGNKGYTLSDVTQVPATIRVLMPDDTVVVMDMDEYLKGVVPHEVSPYWTTESLRAQAVAARSYAATRHAHGDADVCTTVHCQVWSAVHYDTTDQAVDDTHGQAATYGGAIISAFFFGHCDGHTRNSEDVWGGYLPYCRSVICPCGFDFMWGHGVGMCQEGARVMAEQGTDYKTILAHYYSGVQVFDPQAGAISDALVAPSSGDTLTEFAYSMTYHSPLGDAPVAVHVIIDGRAVPLIRVGGSTEDGWRYRAVTTLPAGDHAYQFYVDDGYGNVARSPSASGSGPSVFPHGPADSTPTPVAHPLGEVQTHQAYASTEMDWADCALDGVDIISDGDGAVRLNNYRTSASITSSPVSVPSSFSAVGAIWHVRGTANDIVDVAVRVSEDGATWSDWQDLAQATDGPARHAVGETTLAYLSGQYVQWRADLSSAETGAMTLDNLAVICLDASSGPDALLSEPPAVISRASWGADEALMLRPLEYRTPVAVVLHHTSPGAPSTAAAVRALYAYDGALRERGDLGANYYIDGEGVIYEGRAGGERVVGAHSGRYDYGTIGVALLDEDGSDLPTEAALASLSRLLAWRCVDYAIDPHAEVALIDTMVPTIMSACDLGLVSCGSDALHDLLPGFRDRVASEMANVPPTVAIDWPQEGDPVRAVVRPELSASAVITEVRYYVDGDLRATEFSAPGTWRWNTTLAPDGPHELRMVVANAAGQDDATVWVTVDNTPPTGSITAPAWDDSIWVPISLNVQGATSVQFSNGWVWEGEDLPHTSGTGNVVADAQARNGSAWYAQDGVDAPGGWFGPYVCELTGWRNYDVYHLLKTDNNTEDLGLATLDIVDDQGRRVYVEQPISALDFLGGDQYVEFRLPLAYEGQWPTCDDANVDDGLEFRVWYSGAGDLSWDRVSVFTEKEPLESPYYWGVRDLEGQQRVLVRALDEAGNALEQELLIGLDRQDPVWAEYGMDYACVEDAGSGIDPGDLWYAVSADGTSWSGWNPLTDGIHVQSAQRVCVSLPEVAGGYVAFLARDRMGREATSQPMVVPQETPQPSLTATPTWTPMVTPSLTATVTETPTPSLTATQTDLPTPTVKPTGSPTPDGTVTLLPTLPTPAARLWLPLVSRH